jgi:hypothetical protein
MSNLCSVLLLQKYRITKRVGGGSFGDIYLGVGANGEKVRYMTFFKKRITQCTSRDMIRSILEWREIEGGGWGR